MPKRLTAIFAAALLLTGCADFARDQALPDIHARLSAAIVKRPVSEAMVAEGTLPDQTVTAGGIQYLMWERQTMVETIMAGAVMAECDETVMVRGDMVVGWKIDGACQ